MIVVKVVVLVMMMIVVKVVVLVMMMVGMVVVVMLEMKIGMMLLTKVMMKNEMRDKGYEFNDHRFSRYTIILISSITVFKKIDSDIDDSHDDSDTADSPIDSNRDLTEEKADLPFLNKIVRSAYQPLHI